jgi:hypothetical protein
MVAAANVTESALANADGYASEPVSLGAVESPKTVCPKNFYCYQDVSRKKGVGLALGGAFQII